MLLFLWSCSKEMISDSINNSNTDTKNDIKSETVTPAQVPDIINFIEQKSNADLEFQIDNTGADMRNHEEDLVISSVLTNQINQVTNSAGKSSYTFELIQEGDKSGIYFMNLIVKEYLDELYLYIIKYVPDSTWLKSYKSNHDFAHFSGMIYYYDSDGVYLGKGTMVNGSSISTENRNNCPPNNGSNTSDDSPNGNPSGGGGATGGDASTGSSGTGGGLYWIYVTVYHTIPSGETFEFGPGSECQHPGECIVTVVVEFVYQEQDRTVRNLVDCPEPEDCYDSNGDPCTNGCDENGQCIEDISDVESAQSGVLIDSNLERIVNQLNDVIGPDNYEFFIPSTDEETLDFDSFEDFEEYYNNNDFEFTDYENIIDGQLRTDIYYIEVDALFNTGITATIQTEQPEPNSEECMEIISLNTSLSGNSYLFSWNPYEEFDVITLPQFELLRVEFYGELTQGFSIAGIPFRVTKVHSFRINYDYTTGEFIEGIHMSVD